MSKIEDGDSAFPCPDTEYRQGAVGMTLRDWFAGQFASTLIWKCEETDGGWSPENVAAGSYALADAMIAARKTGGDE